MVPNALNLEARIEEVAQAVAEQVEGEHRKTDSDAGAQPSFAGLVYLQKSLNLASVNSVYRTVC